MDYYGIDSSGNLYHWGIKGMKWGQRRYQNKDGSLTPAGKKRYAQEEATLKERERAIKNRERENARRAKLDAKKADLDAREAALNGERGKKKTTPSDVPQKKSIKDMTDAELNDAIARARLEDTYRNLRPEPVAKPSFGKQLVSDVAKPALMNSGKKALEAIIDKSVKDLLKDKVDPNSLEALKNQYDKLSYKRKIDKLKNGEDPDEKPMTWEDKLRKQKWEDNERNRAEKEAEKEAQKKAADDAKKAAEEQARRDSKERSSTAKRGKEAFKKLNDKIDWDEYLWGDDD